MCKHLAKYIVAAALVLAVCFWFLPARPLVEAGLTVEMIEIIQVDSTLQNTEQYTFVAGDAEYEEILSVLGEYSYHSCFHTLLGWDSLFGNRAGYWQQIYLQTGSAADNTVSIICGGTGEFLIGGKTYHMSTRKQRQMMEDLRQIYQL